MGGEILGGFTILGVFLTIAVWLNGRSTKKFIKEVNETTQKLIFKVSEQITKMDERTAKISEMITKMDERTAKISEQIERIPEKTAGQAR